MQIIQDTTQFRSALLNDVRGELEQLKKEFEPKTPTEYLTRQEVARLLQVDLSTVHNWTKSGKLKSYGIGHRVYYKRTEVEKAIQPLNHKLWNQRKREPKPPFPFKS